MAFDKITEYSATNASNTSIGDVNVQEGMLPSSVNDALREQMTHLKESLGSGTPLYVDQTNNRLGVNNAAPATALDVTGTVTADGLTVDTSTLHVDSTNNRVGIGTTSPSATFEVNGNAIAKTDTDTTNTGSVTLDFGANQNFVLTLTGNVTLANPSTEQVGQSGFITFIQDGTGGRTVSLGTDYETAAGAGLTLSSAASTTDIVPYVVVASGRILLGAPQLAFA